MLNCSKCSQLFKSISDLVKHCSGKGCGQRQLSLKNQRKRFVCTQGECRRSYSLINSFSKHLYRKHHGDEVSNVLDSSSVVHELSPSTSSSLGEELVENIQILEERTKSFLENSLSSLISSVYANPNIPRNAVQLFMGNFEQFMDTYLSNVEKYAHSLVISHQISSIEMLQFLKNLFLASKQKISTFNSEFKRMKYFENVGAYVPSIEVQIATRNDVKNNRLTTVPVTLQVVPVGKVLQKLLSFDHIFKDILNYRNYLSEFSAPIVNIIQGTAWQKRGFVDSENILHFPLILYFDDFEVNNPLGSHAGIQKLGGVYLSLPFLPPNLSSKLDNILILSLFHSSDRITYGNKLTFQSVIDELNDLCKVGIQVDNALFSGNIFFHVAAITGDNLGLNGILGFTESFNSTYCCRTCTIKKSEIQVKFVEVESLLRTDESYERDLLLNDASLTGIKEKCIWLELENFSLFEHIAVDLLHDFLEGCCRYVMNHLVTYLVKDAKLISFSILKSKIVSFDYGPDSSSKPTNALNVDSSKIHVKTSGSEMFTLVRYFGLIAGPNVPEGNEIWEVYLLLRQLLDRLFSRKIYHTDCKQLEVLVEHFLYFYVKNFKDTLKPKFHFLTHYSKMLSKFGPLHQISTIRFESKHKVSKVAARSAVSRINICKTIVIRNQLSLSELFLQDCHFDDPTFGLKTKVPSELLIMVQDKTNHSNFSSVKYLVKNGVRLEVSDVITWDICSESGNPCLAKVQAIYIDDDDSENIVFKCSHLTCLDFNFHFHAYEIEIPDGGCFFFLAYKSLFSVVPNNLSILSNGRFYVTLRDLID